MFTGKRFPEQSRKVFPPPREAREPGAVIPPRAVKPSAAPVSLSLIRRAAFNLLARREYSRHELSSKLLQKFGAEHQPLVQEALDIIQQEGLQSDARYIEMFVRAHRQRGQGPQRIEQELKQKGIAVERYAEVIDRYSDSWIQAAREVRMRRFGMVLPTALADRARQQRFLLYRGFSQEQVRRALNPRE